MQAVVWSDYLCPWCYLGRDRTALLRELGVAVRPRPYELHPEIPPEGIASNRRYSRIGAACEEAGMPFRPPTHVPNTRRALRTALVVETRWPDSFAAFDDALFAAYFVDGRDIGDPDVLDDLAAAAGADAAAVRGAVDAGAGTTELRDSMDDAVDHGVGGTPAWLLDGRVLIPGVQDRDYYRLVVDRIRSRPPPSPASPPTPP